MLCLPGIVLLVAFIYVRPQEVYTGLQALPLLYIFLGLAVFGAVVDVKLGFLRLRGTVQHQVAIAFLGWCTLTIALRAPWYLTAGLRDIMIPASLFFLLAFGVQTFRTLEVFVASLLALVLFLSYIGVDQGLNDSVCHMVDWREGSQTGIPDGRPCETPRGCEQGEGAVAGADYLCEKPGMLNTHSIGRGRVRYRGILEDPNELSLAGCVAIPFAFAFFERKKSTMRTLLLLGTIGIVGLCTVFSQSRGGQVVFLTATGVYFIRRFGWRGILIGAALAAPMLLFGGRSGEEADSSAEERTMCLYVGMQMFRQSPLIGVGQGQFVEHHILTAHNSYVLTAAELGLPGMTLWVLLLYVSMKIPVSALRQAAAGDIELAPVARAWGVALAASLTGMFVGIFFLSFAYHDVLWIALGLTGAYQASVRVHEPRFDVSLNWREIAAVAAFCTVLVVLITVYAGYKVSHP